jgi:hypothetical protein
MIRIFKSVILKLKNRCLHAYSGWPAPGLGLAFLGRAVSSTPWPMVLTGIVFIRRL